MGIEVERKFRISNDGWRSRASSARRLVQGYLAAGEVTVRVREDGQNAWLTIKGPPEGISRAEFEYPVPVADARILLAMCGTRIVVKVRHQVPFGGRVWEVDEFCERNAGLVLAEIELPDPSAAFDRPDWLGPEVSHEPKYTNANLALNAYSLWAEPAQ